MSQRELNSNFQDKLDCEFMEEDFLMHMEQLPAMARAWKRELRGGEKTKKNKRKNKKSIKKE